jgi:uncharacterized protein with von Willebrand factor type A (vWA) domain
LLKLELGLGLDEIKRFSRFCSRNEENEIIYAEFLRDLRKLDKKAEQNTDFFVDFTNFCKKLQEFLNKNDILSASELLDRASRLTGISRNLIKLDVFTKFLK